MVNNWGQHAFVDDDEPDSDYRSSITVIDTKVNTAPFQVPTVHFPAICHKNRDEEKSINALFSPEQPFWL